VRSIQHSRRAPLLSTGLLCLALSFLITALGGESAPPAMAWAHSAGWWVGLICVAGHVLRLALSPVEAPQDSTEHPTAVHEATHR